MNYLLLLIALGIATTGGAALHGGRPFLGIFAYLLAAFFVIAVTAKMEQDAVREAVRDGKYSHRTY